MASHAREPSKNSVPSHWSQSQVTTTKLAGGLEHIFLMGYNGVFNGTEWDIISNNGT